MCCQTVAICCELEETDKYIMWGKFRLHKYTLTKMHGQNHINLLKPKDIYIYVVPQRYPPEPTF